MADLHTDNQGAEAWCTGIDQVWECIPRLATKLSVDLVVAISLTYFAITCSILLYKMRFLNALPYDRLQGEVVFYRLQVSFTAVLFKCNVDLSLADSMPAIKKCQQDLSRRKGSRPDSM